MHDMFGDFGWPGRTRTAIVIGLVGLASLGLGPGGAAGAGQDQPASTAPSQATTSPGDAQTSHRVIVVVNRNQTSPGTIVHEDDETIRIRNLRDEIEDFPKSRVMQIVRLVDPQPGQTGMVIMRDGQVREGVIIEDAFEHVLIEIQGIRAKLKRESVSHVVLQATIEERYQQYKAAIQPGNHDALLKLCQWLIDRKQYELARTNLLELLEQADLPDARKMLTLAEAQLELERTRPRPQGHDKTDQPHQPETDAGQERNHVTQADADASLSYVISDADVNIIRVYELDFEHRVHVTITPETVRELIEKYGTSDLIPASQAERNSLFRAAADRPMDLVRLMFELKARDLYPQIQVKSEPHALNLFRTRVHDTWLMNTCATSRCHGSPHAGRLYLHRRNYKSDNVRFTNLLILERLKLDPEWPLINYEDPERSLILQYALPRNMARKPHPRVTDWKPAFSPSNPRGVEDALEWIRAMMIPRPDYPVDYQPPVVGQAPEDLGATGQPSTEDLNNPRPDPDRPPR